MRNISQLLHLNPRPARRRRILPKQQRAVGAVQTVIGDKGKQRLVAKFGIKAQLTIDNMNSQLGNWRKGYNELKTAFDNLQEKVKLFMETMKEAPERVYRLPYLKLSKSQKNQRPRNSLKYRAKY